MEKKVIFFKSLTKLARFSIDYFLKKREEPKIEPKKIPKIWKKGAACFVTLSRKGKLCGCIGTVLADKPLYLDVVKNAIGAAFRDSRFEPLKKKELEDLEIEISVLAKPKKLKYETSREVLDYLYENKPGVMIVYGGQRAVFIPRVWQEIRGAEDFLSHLCLKAGLPPEFWRVKRLAVWVFGENKAL